MAGLMGEIVELVSKELSPQITKLVATTQEFKTGLQDLRGFSERLKKVELRLSQINNELAQVNRRKVREQPSIHSIRGH